MCQCQLFIPRRFCKCESQIGREGIGIGVLFLVLLGHLHGSPIHEPAWFGGFRGRWGSESVIFAVTVSPLSFANLA